MATSKALSQLKTQSPRATNRAPVGKPKAARLLGEGQANAVDVVKLVSHVQGASPAEVVEIERRGIPGTVIKGLAREMDLSATRLYAILGIAKATVEKKASSGEQIAGAGGFATLGILKLIGQVQTIVADSSARTSKEFDAGKWLGAWIEKPQQALGGKRPAELLDTPTGFAIVSKVLGAIHGGAYL